MKITGSNVVPAPVAQVWDALLDPRVLVATIPGCQRLEETGEHEYAMTVTAGVAAIRGTYAGTCTLSDLKEHESLVMRLRGAGAPGTIDATVNVAFSGSGDGTRVDYDADAVVGGTVAGVGQRMLTSVAKRMAGEFFANVAASLVEQPVGEPVVEPVGEPMAEQRAPGAGGPALEAAGRPRGAVFTRPAGPTTGKEDFVKGIAVGAGLVLLGVVAGAVLGRRR